MSHRQGHHVHVSRCPHCNHVHLVVREKGRIVTSVPLTREDWAQLIGAYGEMIGAGLYDSNEGENP